METVPAESIEEQEPEGVIRERFRQLLCERKQSLHIQTNEITLYSEGDRLQMKKRNRKRSLHIDNKDDELLCIVRSPSSPFLDYTASSSRKPLRRSESLGSCLTYDSLTSEGIDMDSATTRFSFDLDQPSCGMLLTDTSESLLHMDC